MMKQAKTLLVAVVAAVIIQGCSETTRTAEYYLEHDVELQDKLSECKNNPGELMRTPNCINAMKARKKQINDSMFNGSGVKPGWWKK